MKQFLKKIGAICLAFVVLFTTMSFTISEHYCGDELVARSVITKAESCDMEIQEPVFTEDCIIQKDNCCSDEIKQIEGQSELITQVLDLDFEQQVFVASFVYTYINLFEGLDQKIVHFQNYSPPLVDKDLQIFFQTFLI